MKWILILLLMMTGCVSIHTHEIAKIEARLEALTEAAEVADRYECIDAAMILRGKVAVALMKKISIGVNR